MQKQIGRLLVGTFLILGVFVGCSEDDFTREVTKCETSKDCAACETCEDGICMPKQGCIPCDEDGKCPNDLVCDQATGECVPNVFEGDGDVEFEQDLEPTEQTDQGSETISESLDGDEENESQTEIEADPIEPDAPEEEVVDTEEDTDLQEAEPPELESEFEPEIQDDGVAEQEFEQEEVQTGCPNPTSSEPVLFVQPIRVDFGEVLIGERSVRSIRLCNGGYSPLYVYTATISRSRLEEFHVDKEGLPILLEGGRGTDLTLWYAPVDAEDDTSQLILRTNSSISDIVRVDLVGRVKRIGKLLIQPRVVQFTNEPSEQDILLTNLGLAALTITAITIEDPNEPVQFTLNTDISDLPWSLDPEVGVVLQVGFAASIETPERASLKISWHDGQQDHTDTLPLIPEVSGICAQPNAGEDLLVAPRRWIRLNGLNSVDPNDVHRSDENWFYWEIISKPENSQPKMCKDLENCGNIVGTWSNVGAPLFFPDLAGEYVIALRVNPDDDPGCEAVMDTVTVQAVPDSNIYIELLWDRPHNDHDLHLVRHHTPSMGDEIGCFKRGDANNINDCHWQNCNTYDFTDATCPPRGCPGPLYAPDWGVVELREDDPMLVNDTIAGPGPEITLLDIPEPGEYFVAVERYSGEDVANLVLKVWINGELTSVFRKQIPNITYHWNVCWLHVRSPSEITVEPIDLIKPSISEQEPDCNPAQPAE